MVTLRQLFTGARTGKELWMTPQVLQGLFIILQAVLLTPAGVEVCRRSWAIRYDNTQPINNTKNIDEVLFPETGPIEVIDAQVETAGGAGELGVERKVSRITPVQES